MKKFSQHIDKTFIKIINEGESSENNKHSLEEKNAIINYYNKNINIEGVDIEESALSQGEISFNIDKAYVTGIGLKIVSNELDLIKRSEEMILISKNLLLIKKWSDSIDFLEFIIFKPKVFSSINYKIELDIDKILELEESKNFLKSAKSIGKFNL